MVFCLRVYPRWRGEHLAEGEVADFYDGLSPLARGTRGYADPAIAKQRFIPAGAGNTTLLLLSTYPPSVYPRWRGEHAICSGLTWLHCGLSPLARGTPAAAAGTATITRFIPAGAGNTSCSASHFCIYSVYPRWRGEHAHHQGPAQKIWRFIPAGAGNTVPSKFSAVARAVYPRWRGEHISSVDINFHANGLSPLARGTRRCRARQTPTSRFIPAGAGNTRALQRRACRGAVYPRWRGEHQEYAGIDLLCRGLSPLARGTHRYKPKDLSRLRFIPAGAGNTRPAYRPPLWLAVYPRWRGEHAVEIPNRTFASRFIPAGAGNTPVLLIFFLSRRFIPAGAGNTPELLGGYFRDPVYPRWRGEHDAPISSYLLTAGLSPLARGTLNPKSRRII